MLAERSAGELRVAQLAYPALPAADLCAGALRELGETPGGAPEAQLLRRARREAEAGRALLLVVDDAQSIPADAATRLRALADASRGDLRLLAVATELPPEQRLRLAPEHEVPLREPLDRDELGRYVARRLESAQVDAALRGRFDRAALDRLQLDSGGVPARVHAAATAILRGAGLAPAVMARPPDAGPSARAGPAAAVAAPARAPRRAPRARLRLVAAFGAVLLGAGAGLLVWPPSGRDVPPPSPPPRAPARAPSVPEPAAPPEPPPAEPLPAPPAPVRVHLNATPWAAIEVDGSPLGETPLAAVALAPGPHRFVARMADGRVIERILGVDEDHRHLAFE